MSVAVIAVLCFAFAGSERISSVSESLLYADRIVYAKQTRFQRIVMTAGRGGHHLFLDGNLQVFLPRRVQVPRSAGASGLQLTSEATNGCWSWAGGDGLAVREILRYPDVEQIVLVDIDPGMTELARNHAVFVRLNADALDDSKVQVINDDAMAWLREGDDRFDIVVIDFPDPNNYTLGKLYTTTFYRLVLERLDPKGAIVVQSTSPLMARESYWCIVSTLQEVGMNVLPYHAFVPSFGEWGYVLASPTALQIPSGLPEGLHYLNDDVMKSLFVFSPDIERVSHQGESAEQPGVGALLRVRVEAHALMRPTRRDVLMALLGTSGLALHRGCHRAEVVGEVVGADRGVRPHATGRVAAGGAGGASGAHTGVNRGGRGCWIVRSLASDPRWSGTLPVARTRVRAGRNIALRSGTQ